MKLPAWLRRCLARVEAATSGYLDHVGWFRTRGEGKAVDRHGEPMPWFTYPAVSFFSDRVRPEMRVLEFGSGMGTMWWSRRVRDVVAVEHHPGWAKHVAASCTARVVNVPADDANEYVRAARECAPYDIVVVDGIFRNECMAVAGDLLRDGGVVVLDDAQRGEYQPGIDALRNRGYRVVEFHGPQPVSKHAGCTAVFYRDGNVLGL